jgi:spermidine synthase
LEVLLVDGFDIHGQPPQLCSQEFYDDCYRALAPDGVLVVNLCGLEDRRSIERIRRSFDDRVLVVIPEDGENKIVIRSKGRTSLDKRRAYQRTRREIAVAARSVSD